MSRYHDILTITVEASGAVTKYRGVKADGAQVDAKGDPAIGFSQYDAADGEPLALRRLGTSIVEAGAAVPAGESVGLDALGRVVPWEGGHKVGIARSAAAQAADLIEVFCELGLEEDPTIELITAAGAIAVGQAVGYDDDVAGAGEAIKGIALEAADEVGDQIYVQVLGLCDAISGAAVAAAGTELEVGTTGRLITLNSGIKVGEAWADADGADESMRVCIK